MSQNRFRLHFSVHSDGLGTATQHGGSAPPADFHLFRNLPPELRLKIWECLLVPRIITVSCMDTEEPDMQSVFDLHSRGSSPSLVPSLLHVNHESRAVALGYYELTFSWKVPLVLSSMDLSPSLHRMPSENGIIQQHQNQHQPQLPKIPGPSGFAAPEWSEPRIYFSFAHDALLLLGELELYDAANVHSPMSYFLRKDDSARVRKVAVAFSALRYGENGPQQIFGSLFHIVDRFRPADGRVLICVTPRDEHIHAMLGGDGGPLVGGDEGVDEVPLLTGDNGVDRAHGADLMDVTAGGETADGAMEADAGIEVRAVNGGQVRENVIQKIWRSWYRGSIVTSSLAEMDFKLIRLADLKEYVA